jgi:hypothetical protein
VSKRKKPALKAVPPKAFTPSGMNAVCPVCHRPFDSNLNHHECTPDILRHILQVQAEQGEAFRRAMAGTHTRP